MIKAGIVCSTGYVGYQLSAILSRHKDVSIEFLSSHNYSNMKLSDVYENLEGFVNNYCIDIFQNELYDLYQSYYKNEKFIRITETLPDRQFRT